MRKYDADIGYDTEEEEREQREAGEGRCVEDAGEEFDVVGVI